MCVPTESFLQARSGATHLARRREVHDGARVNATLICNPDCDPNPLKVDCPPGSPPTDQYVINVC